MRIFYAMASSELDTLIEHILADPACSISPNTVPVEFPANCPDDVRHFFTRCSDGGLYFEPDFPTPQFGCQLEPDFSTPIAHCMEDYMEEADCFVGEEFESLYALATLNSGDFESFLVSLAPATYGRIYFLSYSLGDPQLTFADLAYVAPSFTRFLEMHVEAWAVYLKDWREGCKHYGNLIDAENRLAGLKPRHG